MRRAGLTAVLAVTLLAPGVAVAVPVAAVAAVVRPAAVAGADGVAAVDAFDDIETATRTRPVAPGLTLTSFDRYHAAGWLRADALTADLSGALTVDYVNAGAVAQTAPLRAAANRTRAVAAVNGDFFDINNSGAAQGIGIQGGQLVQSPIQGRNNAVGVTAGGVGRVVEVHFDGTATLPGGVRVPLTQFNNMVQAGGVGVFTPLWGSYDRRRAVDGATAVTEVVLTGGTVAEVRAAAGTGPIPAGTTILLGRDAGAAALAALRPGDAVDVAYAPKPSDGSTLKAAAGGRQVLVKDGVPQDIGDVQPEPRTAVGFSADGRRMYLVTVDGRQADSRGVTLTELGRLMAELGAHNALNLDGGGSSTLVAREPGQAEVQVENSPSDGSERPVPNGLALYAPAGSGRLAGYWVETADDKVFPGLTRRVTAAGYDETYGPAAGAPRWSATHGYVDDGLFHAVRPGVATVTARRGHAAGSVKVTVLGALDRIDTTVDRIGLSGMGGASVLGVVGFDGDGNDASIEPADVRLSYDTSLLDVTPTADGRFSVRAKKDVGGGLLTLHVGRSTVAVPVTVGLEDVPVAGFDDAASWTFSHARAAGAVAPAAGHTGAGLKMSYDFGLSTGIRAAYANPPAWIAVPGQPHAFGMWIHGNGTGEWPSLHLHDALDQQHVLRGPLVTWTGWRYVEMAVPAGVQYPVRIRRFYVAETNAAAAYRSEVVIDDIVAKVPPTVAEPVEELRTDRIVVRDGTVDGARWRFAVMSDAQFVAANPDSDLVAQARRTLREVKAARPDFLLINGDFVDTAYPADFALAKRILDEELGGELPYYYVPGNHEILGAPIANFAAVFGATSRVFDHKGLRFVTLNSSTGTLRGGGFDQVKLLRSALDSAATDRAVRGVVVLHHHPPRDPTPAKGSQLGDRKEAALLEEWLAGFERRSGKDATFVGAHVGTFHADRVDGVPYLINGNAGKNPSTAPHLGGFTGWTLVGVGEGGGVGVGGGRDSDLAAQTRAHVDALAIAAPATAPRGTAVDVSATITQSGRQVPVAAPVSADWTGSPGVHIGSAGGVRPWHVAWFDPETGKLTALRSRGTVTLAVTVNGASARATIPLS
ncbi:phosphodiester glycosidase family protein [Actinomycetes bacterium KLBMP 9797]